MSTAATGVSYRSRPSCSSGCRGAGSRPDP
jgi:hypothetical protein